MRFWPRLTRPAVAAAAALLARAAVSAWTGAWRTPAVFETDTLVNNVLSGRGYRIDYLGATFRSFHSILPYDLLTAAVYAIAGPRAMLLVQALLAGALVLVAARLGARLGERAAIVAAWLVALWPPLAYYDAVALDQIGLDALLFAGALLCAVRWRERPGAARAIAAGLALGLLLHERATFVLMATFAIAWAARGRPRQALLAGIVAAAVLAPWTIRNAVVHRRFVPTATTAWVNLWKGNNPIATGGELTDDAVPIVSVEGALPDGVRGAPELVQMDRFRAATIAFWSAQPGRALALYARKLGQLATLPVAAGRSVPRAPFVAYQLLYILVVLLAVRAWRRRDARTASRTTRM